LAIVPLNVPSYSTVAEGSGSPVSASVITPRTDWALAESKKEAIEMKVVAITNKIRQVTGLITEFFINVR
jgi:hypothetical protein